MPKRMETLQAIITAVAPLIINSANACKGRDVLMTRRVALASMHSVLVKIKFINYEKGKFPWVDLQSTAYSQPLLKGLE
jgi:hypothetical protein